MTSIIFLGTPLKQWLIWSAVQGAILFIAWLVVKYGDISGEDNGET